MRRFAMVLVVLATACGGGELPLDPTDIGDGGNVETCQPDPTAARVVVPVVLQNDAPKERQPISWSVEYSSEYGDEGELRFLGRAPGPGESSPVEPAIDAIRGARVAFRLFAAQVTDGMLGPPALEHEHTITLDRSCELVISVHYNEAAPEPERFTLSHAWR